MDFSSFVLCWSGQCTCVDPRYHARQARDQEFIGAQMGILRAFKTGNIRENNIVQTVASAGGTLSAIIFVLPGLIMVGWWRSFPFMTTFLVCALGGILGVLFSIPLRRALVVNSTLPF